MQKLPRNILFLTFVTLLTTSNLLAQNGNVTINQDPKLPELLALKTKMTADNELADRYKIQLYYGNITEANSVLNKYKSSFGDWESRIKYETPNYKIWVGNFRNRLEADRALISIHRVFPNAFILKPER